MERTLDSLNYDFKQFSVPAFMKHLEGLRGKTFHFIPRELIQLVPFSKSKCNDIMTT